MGHSNGGQGAWHLASHWPDRVVGSESTKESLGDSVLIEKWLPQLATPRYKITFPTPHGKLTSAKVADLVGQATIMQILH
jgi:hypothetical protein